LKFKKIILYDEPSVSEIHVPNLVKFLKETLPVEVIVKDNFFKGFSNKQIKKVSESRIFEINKPFQRHSSSKTDLEIEEEFCKNSKSMEGTKKPEDATNIHEVVMYDGFEMQKIIRENLLDFEDQTLYVILTNRFTCTYDESDARYHGRAVICANPAIISTTGIVEAPAKSREFYIEAMANMAQGLDIKSVKEKHSGEFLEYHDERLSKVIEGYLLQVIFYVLIGESFCDYMDCRLNNAHWQRDLLYSQIEIRRLCDKHQKILDSQR
jgi:hypothetical protein